MSRAVSVNGLEKMMWMNIFDLVMGEVVYGEVIARTSVESNALIFAAPRPPEGFSQ